MVKGKGQTRSWLIIVPLPAGEKCRKKTSEYKSREQVIAKIMATILLYFILFPKPRRKYKKRKCTIQLVKRILKYGSGVEEQRCLPISLI